MKSVYQSTILALSLLLVPSASAQTVPVSSGRTSIALDSGTLGVLSALKVNLSVTGLGRLSGTTLSFPITVGAVDAATLKTEIQHAGGLTIQLGSTVLQLVNFTVDTTGASPQLSAIAISGSTLLGRVNVFDLTLPAGLAPPVAPAGNALIDVPGVGIALSQAGSDALNSVFGTTLFTKGISIGVARVQALVDADAIP